MAPNFGLTVTIAAVSAWVSAYGLDAKAAVTSTVVDVASRPGVTQRFLWVRPDTPKATIIAVIGGSGVLRIQDDGTMNTIESRCNPFVRNRGAFADEGIALALMDQSSTGSIGALPEVQAVYRHVRARDPVPTWIQGASASTEPIANAAVNFPAADPAGVLFLAPAALPESVLGQIRRPTLIVYHLADPDQSANLVFSRLTAAPVKELVALSGGQDAGCAGPHTFDGLNALVVATVEQLLDKHAASVAPPVSTATAVEFYNAALDHYFLTHVADEIALLDAGVQIRGWVRTGQAFNVYTVPPADASAVCRFYIPPDKGDSHFYGRGSVECTATGINNPSFINETSQFFHMLLPVFGVCPAATRPVYRVFSNRADANHRYMVDSAVRTQMVGQGWVAEGDGPDLVVMCAPQ